MRSIAVCFAATLLVAALAQDPSNAQSTQSTQSTAPAISSSNNPTGPTKDGVARSAHITGLVRDSGGPPLQNVLITLTLQKSSSRFQTRSYSEGVRKGRYDLPDLPPGVYEVAAEAPSHETLTIPTVVLDPNATQTVDLTLRSEECAADKFPAAGPLLLCIFLLSIFIVRWHNIAVPNRNLLRARAQDVVARAEKVRAERERAQTTPDKEEKHPDLSTEHLHAVINQTESFWSMAKNFFFWSRGEENATFNSIHYLELALLEAPSLSYEKVNARLATARQQLAISDDALGKAFAARIKEAFDCSPRSSPADLRELLIEVQYYLYSANDTGYSTLTSWQNKSIWLTLVGLMLITVLGVLVEHRYILFVVGAAGGFLSRLMQQLKRANVPNDYGASWSTLFLSPVLGALTGWFGVLLISFANEPTFGLLGGPLRQVDWNHPCAPGTLFAAFLLGFSERLFSGIVKKLEDQIDNREAQAKKAPEAPAPMPQIGPKPGINPAKGPAGTKVEITPDNAPVATVDSVELIPETGAPVIPRQLTKAGPKISFFLPDKIEPKIYKVRLIVQGKPVDTNFKFEVTAPSTGSPN